MKRTAKQMAALLLVFLLTAFPLAGALAKGWDKSEDARNCIVRVVYAPNDSMEWRIGTGFFVGKAGSPVEYIITNAHVVGTDNGNETCSQSIGQVYIVFDRFDSETTQIAIGSRQSQYYHFCAGFAPLFCYLCIVSQQQL